MPAITFDGSNDYLSISSRLGFSANPDLSVFAVTSFISNIAPITEFSNWETMLIP